MSPEFRITLPVTQLTERLRRLAQAPTGLVASPAGVSLLPSGGVEVIAAQHPLPSSTTLLLWSEDDFSEQPPLKALAESVIAVVQVGKSAAMRGHVRGWMRNDTNVWQPFTELLLPGRGMHRVSLPGSGASFSESRAEELTAEGFRWSRTVAALGPEVYRRAVALRVGLNGLGRTGSLLARRLLRFGIRRFVAVDMDKVETSNCGESEFEPSQVGQWKVQAWREQALTMSPEAQIEAVAETVTSHVALDALKGCDVIFSAPDNAAARLAAGAIGAAYGRPLIDVGTAIHRTGTNRLDADIRLVMPGERCLLDFGSVAHEAAGLRILESPDEEEWFTALRDWREERPGSLASINATAAGVALRMFEDLVAGRIPSSLWCNLAFQADGTMHVSYPNPERAERGLCACDIAGWGDGGLRHFTAILRRRQEAQAVVPPPHTPMD